MALLLASDGEAATAKPAGIPRRPAGADAPLSFAQQRLWFLDRLVPGNAAYNISAAFVLSGALDGPALERSVHAVIARHESLRTVFIEDADGQPVQRVRAADAAGEAVQWADVSAEADPGAAARRIAAEEAARPFELAQGAPVRVRILRLAATEHAVVCTLHHIVSDGWSTGVLIREIAAHYATPGTIAPLPVQYGDFATWQRAKLTGPELERQLGWWRERLAGLPVLELPTDFPRPAVQSFRGARVALATDAALRDGLAQRAREAGTTLFATLLAAVQVALAAWSGQRDFAVGAPVAGRTRGELEPLIGFFVNTLVLRTELAGDPTGRELLARTKQNLQAALAHQDVPFEKLVEALNPDRQLGTTPLVQAMFSLENAPDGGLALPGLRLTPIVPEGVVAKFELTVGLTDGPNGLRGAVDYAADLFTAASVERFAALLQRVLRGLVENPDTRVSALAAPDAAEREELGKLGSGERVVEPSTRPAPELIAAWARRTPEATALVDAGGTITFAEMLARADRVAAGLRRRGVGREHVVATALERSAALVVVQLGIWRAGAAYLPLDPAHPAERLAWMAGDAAARWVITTMERRGDFGAVPTVTAEELAADGAGAEADAGVEREAGGAVATRDLAYVIYTSGSTGRPKGVAVEHGALLNLIDWHRQAFGVTAADRGTLVAGVAFDAAVWETWPYLGAGAAVAVASAETVAAPERLRDWILETGATVSFAPTPLAERLLALPWPERTRLRWLLAGGDRLRAAPPAGLPFALSNNYGPTEHAVVATSGPVAGGDRRVPDIGRPIANTVLRLLDAAGRPVPRGAVGEISLGGPSLARGYLGRPELTAEKFIGDPQSERPGARLYRTGDLGRWREDGTLEFRGRADHQVKIRGHRIEPGEIEAAVLAHPGVTGAVVEVRVWRGEPALVAYVAPAVDETALRAALRATLPAAMVPSVVVMLAALPLTANGKVDRRALPAPSEEANAAASAAVAPANALEAAIAGVWCEVLGRAAVGATDNFFDLGGHSLLLVQVQVRLQTLLGRAIPVVALFAHPTVRTLAAQLGGDAGSSGRAPGDNDATERAARQRAALARKRAGRGGAV